MEQDAASETTPAFDPTKLKLLRLNPLTLDGGALVLMGAVQLEGGKINMFPCRLEYDGVPVEFETYFED